jgi:hypothetical protein
MSSIAEKIQHSGLNEINLYKEGVFWIAYEQSAYYLVGKKGYKATKKFIKSIGMEVVSIGFPSSAYDAFIRTLPVLRVEVGNPAYKKILLREDIDLPAFREWKSSLELRSTDRTAENRASGGSLAGTISGGDYGPEVRTLLAKLRNFSLAEKTPLECMLFLSELKNQDYGNV